MMTKSLSIDYTCRIYPLVTLAEFIHWLHLQSLSTGYRFYQLVTLAEFINWLHLQNLSTGYTCRVYQLVTLA